MGAGSFPSFPRRGLEIGHFRMSGRPFPAFPRRGVCAHQRFQKCAQTGRLVMPRSLLIDFREALLMELRRLRVCLPTAPSAPIRTLRDIYLMAQPPRLGKAGNGLAFRSFWCSEIGQSPVSPPLKGGECPSISPTLCAKTKTLRHWAGSPRLQAYP